MDSKKLLILLGSIVVVLFIGLGMLTWNLLYSHKVTTDSTVAGTTLGISNSFSLGLFLTDTGFWNRTQWDMSNQGAVQGNKVKSLKVVFTDQYQFATKGFEGEDLSLSSQTEVIGDEFIITIQTSKTGEQANQAIQREFVRVMSFVPDYDTQVLTQVQNKYKQPFFKLTTK